jgi:prepilin peptidase CpaA
MPLPEIVRWVVAIALSAILVIAALNDVRVRKIPNWTVVAALALFIPWAVTHPLPWVGWAVAAGAVAFAVSFGLYSAGLVGAGDSKLFTAVALFGGLGDLPMLAFATALVGGLIALVSLVARPTRALVMAKMKGKGDFGSGVPYGVAIAAAAALVVWGSVLAPGSGVFG